MWAFLRNADHGPFQRERVTDQRRVNDAIVAYQRLLTHYTAGIVGDLEVAREIVQEALLRFWKADGAQVQLSFEKAWLLRVCRNLAIDARRRQGRVIAVGDGSDAESAGGQASGRAVVAEEAARSVADQELERVLSAVGTLTADQQEVVRLRYQQDLSYKEIAAVTGHGVSNVGVLLHEALKKVRKQLAGRAGEDEAI